MASIDVSEILRASAVQQPPAKRSRNDEYTGNTTTSLPLNTATANASDILAALEDDTTQGTVVDEATVKKLISQLEKKSLKNREMRIKNADDPKKFMESEFELDSAIQEMHSLATQPDLYGCFVENGGPSLLLSLLGHENNDIVGATMNLLQELTDGDVLNEGEDAAADLIECLAKGKIVETFVTAFEKFDESQKDDADALHNALSVVENMMDFRPATVDEAVNQGLFMWLLRRACQKGQFDANKMYASELLASILQTSELAKAKLTEKLDGIDMLLRALAAYKRHDPSSLDEREHMENLFDSLCSSLMLESNRAKFLEGEGLQLMNLMLRERKQSRESSLKVLNHATTGPEGRDNCNKFVEILGLRTLFPLFMRTPAHVKRKDTSPDEHEEHVCSIMKSLLQFCNEDSRTRILSKFTEHEHEKVDRSVELFLKYRERLTKYENRRARQGESENEDVDRLYLDRLDNGLFVLQNISLILTDVCCSQPTALKRTNKLFSMKLKQDKSSKILLPILTEYQANLGEEAVEEKNRVDVLINSLIQAEQQ